MLNWLVQSHLNDLLSGPDPVSFLLCHRAWIPPIQKKDMFNWLVQPHLDDLFTGPDPVSFLVCCRTCRPLCLFCQALLLFVSGFLGPPCRLLCCKLCDTTLSTYNEDATVVKSVRSAMCTFFGDFQAKNTVCTPYKNGSGQSCKSNYQEMTIWRHSPTLPLFPSAKN